MAWKLFANSFDYFTGSPIVPYMNNEIICDTPEAIARFALAALRGRLRLEKVGMKCRGASAKSIAKKMGFTGKIDEQIAKITAKLAETK